MFLLAIIIAIIRYNKTILDKRWKNVYTLLYSGFSKCFAVEVWTT